MTPPSGPTAESSPQGFRADLRRTLYLAHKYELGCPTEAQCPLYEAKQEAACVTCPKHLTPVEREPNVVAHRRIRLVIWLEDIIRAGCQLGPNDLSHQLWSQLADLKAERNRMEHLLYEQKDQTRKAEQANQKALNEARKIDKIPPPGQSIFSTRKG